jgi:hypothetical protein
LTGLLEMMADLATMAKSSRGCICDASFGLRCVGDLAVVGFDLDLDCSGDLEDMPVLCRDELANTAAGDLGFDLNLPVPVLRTPLGVSSSVDEHRSITSFELGLEVFLLLILATGVEVEEDVTKLRLERVGWVEIPCEEETGTATRIAFLGARWRGGDMGEDGGDEGGADDKGEEDLS